MSQTDQKDISEDVNSIPTSTPLEMDEKKALEKTIGPALRKARQEKGLSYEALAEKTRFRPHILEAMENESWKDLPSPAFAYGFLQSYGRALGMPDQEISELYKRTRVDKTAELEPLLRPVKSRKALFIVLAILLLSLIPLYFFWRAFTEEKVLQQQVSSETDHKTQGQDERPQIDNKDDDSNTNAPIPDSFSDKKIDSGVTKPDVYTAQDVETQPSEPATAFNTSESGAPEMLLKAHFTEETWVKIFVDDRSAKEYIFRPGEDVAWKAREGFEILVGNAAGIHLEFEGKKVEDLGSPGQVVRGIFPKGYKRKKQQD